MRPSEAQVVFKDLELFRIQQIIGFMSFSELQLFENSGWSDETFQISWGIFTESQFRVNKQVGDLVQSSADQVHIVHISHWWQITQDFQPNFLRQFGPASWRLKKFQSFKLELMIFHDLPWMTCLVQWELCKLNEQFRTNKLSHNFFFLIKIVDD